jgi:hypothetical protein
MIAILNATCIFLFAWQKRAALSAHCGCILTQPLPTRGSEVRGCNFKEFLSHNKLKFT